jgi:hypothetical protein
VSADAIAVGIGVAVLVGMALVFGAVIEWFGYRRHGLPVDHRRVGIGFIVAGAIAAPVVLLTDGPWIVGLGLVAAGVVYLGRSRGA